MGQTCNTIIFAASLPNLAWDDDGLMYDRLADAACAFKGMCARVFSDAGRVGFELATGGSGHRGAADLHGVFVPFSLRGLEEHAEIGPMLRRARERWPEFVEHVKAKTSGKVILKGKPAVYLTETETA